MQKKKEKLRRKYFSIRKKKYYEIDKNFFNPLISLIKKRYAKKKINLSSYYPSSYELNVTKIFETKIIKKLNILLPVLKKSHSMQFHKWKKNDVLKVNKYGMLEPSNYSNQVTPDIMLIPMLAYDNQKNRLGYGGGFYDRYLNQYLKISKNILTIGIAFSFQKYHKLPLNKNDVKLNLILNEKGIF